MSKHKEMKNSNMGSEGTYHFGFVEDLINYQMRRGLHPWEISK